MRQPCGHQVLCRTVTVGAWNYVYGDRSTLDPGDPSKAQTCSSFLARTSTTWPCHVPFRRDCLVCQQSLQQQSPHRKVQHPLDEVLSIDTTGPFIGARDVGGYKAAYILVGALTWTVPKDSKLKEEEVGELEEGAPKIEAKKDEEAPIPIEDQEPEPAVQGIFDEEEEEEAVEEERAPEGEVEEKEKIEEEGEEKKRG